MVRPCLGRSRFATYLAGRQSPEASLTDRPRIAPDAEVLPRPVAERLLKRASELDAVRSAGSAVAELRAAAAEAGISAESFDAALGELQTEQAPAPVPVRAVRRWRRLFFGLAGVGAAVIAAATIVIPLRLVPPTAAMVQQTIQLNCLPAGEAIELIKPLLTDPATTIAFNEKAAPRSITIRATPEQIRNVRAAIDQVDNPGTCARP